MNIPTGQGAELTLVFVAKRNWVCKIPPAPIDGVIGVAPLPPETLFIRPFPPALQL